MFLFCRQLCLLTHWLIFILAVLYGHKNFRIILFLENRMLLYVNLSGSQSTYLLWPRRWWFWLVKLWFQFSTCTGISIFNDLWFEWVLILNFWLMRHWIIHIKHVIWYININLVYVHQEINRIMRNLLYWKKILRLLSLIFLSSCSMIRILDYWHAVWTLNSL